MKGLRSWLVAGVASTMLLLLSLSPASALQYLISKAGETAPISQLIVAPGEVINLSVWIQHTGEVKGIEVMMGWDRSNTMGVNATPLDNKIVLNGTVDTAVTNIYDGLGAPIFKRLAGARATTTTGPRPWGLRIVWASLTGIVPEPPVRLFDISLRNDGLMPGDPNYPIVIWDLGSGASYTSFVILGNGQPLRPGGSTTLELVPVPEPGSLMALATGVVGLAGMALRRRRA